MYQNVEDCVASSNLQLPALLDTIPHPLRLNLMLNILPKMFDTERGLHSLDHQNLLSLYNVIKVISNETAILDLG